MKTFTELEQLNQPEASSYAKETINPRKKTSIRKLFAQLRKLGKTYDQMYGFQDYSQTFLLQARFLAYFTDDYTGIAPLHASYPLYSQMSDQQLRTFYSWRTKARQGQVTDIPIAYVFCYIYELINNIGVESADDGIDKLIFLWTKYRAYDVRLDEYMIEWIRDYYVVNGPTDSFYAVAKRFPVPYITSHEKFGSLGVRSWDISLVEKNSGHKITRMSFYKKGNQKLIQDCITAVFTALDALFKAHEIDLADLYADATLHNYYVPFIGAVYLYEDCQDLTAKLSDYEIYSCKDGIWSVREYSYTHLPMTKAYILKTVEIEMRKALVWRQFISPAVSDSLSAELREGHRSWSQVSPWRKKAYSLLKNEVFERTIQKAVRNYCQTHICIKNGVMTEIKPVEIDLSKLDKIREEHEETAQKLIMEEAAEKEWTQTLAGGKPAKKEQTESQPAKESQKSVKGKKSAHDIPEATPGVLPAKETQKSAKGKKPAREIPEIDFGVMPEKEQKETLAGGRPARKEQTKQEQAISAVSAVSDGFAGLAGALSGEERALVISLLRSEQAPPNSELLIEAVNEKSLAAIEDNIVGYAGETPYVYEEYAGELRASLGGEL